MAVAWSAVTSSSISHTASGHWLGGNRWHSATMRPSELVNCFGSLPPSLRFASSFRPRWRYSVLSESSFESTAGNEAISLPWRSLACSTSGLSTVASSSSSARSATLASTSNTRGRTLWTQRLETCGRGQSCSSSAKLETEALRTRTDSSAEREASESTPKNLTIAPGSRPMGERRNGRVASKNLRAARRTIGFSSAAAVRNMAGRSTNWGCERSSTIFLSRLEVSSHFARKCSAAVTPLSARERTEATASVQRRRSATKSFFTSSARASIVPPRASRPLRSSATTAISVAKTRMATRSDSRMRSRYARKRSAAVGASDAGRGTDPATATSCWEQSSPAPPS
mmetsp:Transcript_116633/g.330500  ORF Transcript_116633/g.330500 Transcript_116633/m.330500 type:complete len:342 (+) Transcript_116633:2447-3472(+)